ncbi:helix-turn-helix domain-containing protein [Variovorax sp. JS1663]|uniref:helix-turn-helix domain-containing protein n=1 Tax=Variovorax sp. JS1663 TaxID=1851577 RepID=UPI000B3422CF|nr:helix-turn-helix domain-containing protein [Variovorax sp. JS1663]OUM00817.1 transcriptional regulator [Variovorax sp. JS1663]
MAFRASTAKPARRSVHNVALYGESGEQPAWADLVHIERIPERSSLFDWEIDLHFHDALIQVLYVTQGGGEAFIDEVRWSLAPPCLIVVPARSVHGFSFHSDVDGPVITAAQKPLESLAATAAPELLAHIHRPVVLRVDPASRHAQALMPLFEAIDRESQVHTAGRVAAGMSLLVALFVQVARIGEVALSAAESARSRRAAQIEHFRALLDARFRLREPTQRYADELGITLGQLTRLCRDVLGMSTQDAVNARVVHEAQRELVYSSLSIKQVAAELGFEDEAYFGRFFKKHTGHRPTEFREMARRQLAAR